MFKRNFIAVLIGLILGAGALALLKRAPSHPVVADVPAASATVGEAYLRGTHWFGSGWAVNMWNTRLLDAARDDFGAIRQDGFNTVVLVVPWPGFAVSKQNGSLEPGRAERLTALIDLAAAEGLDVVLRLGYAWDAAVRRPAQWFVLMWYDADVHQAWLDYMGNLWDVVGQRDNVRFAFISWEDLWAITWVGDAREPRRLEMAGMSGYQDWLRGRVTLTEASAQYGVEFTDWSEVPIPHKTRPEWALFLQFLDDAWIERFFKPAQARFPELSMEIRIDGDTVYDEDGEVDYYHSHESAWDLPGAPWTTIYWSPAMGGMNQGEQLSPETAAERLQYVLEQVRAVAGDRPIFIDQLLVEDYTPGYENNGRMDPDDIPRFLKLAAPVLRAYAHGYALWTWKDYAHNAIPSPDFSFDGGRWTYTPGVQPDPAPGLELDAGEGLRREFAIGEFHAPGGPGEADLCVVAQVEGDAGGAPPAVTLQLGGDAGTTAKLPASGERECVTVGVSNPTELGLTADGDLSIEHMSFSGFTQPIGIRDLDGTPKPVARAWRTLNRTLEGTVTAPFDRYRDGWMGKTLQSDLTVEGPGRPSHIEIDTTLPGHWPFEPQIAVTVDGEPLGVITCRPQGHDRLDLPTAVRARHRLRVSLTVNRTWHPPGDERRLGCQVERVALSAEP